MLRAVVVAISGVRTLYWLVIVDGAIRSIKPATRGLDLALARVASVVFVLFVAPALALGLLNRCLKLALVLAILPFLVGLTGMVFPPA